MVAQDDKAVAQNGKFEAVKFESYETPEARATGIKNKIEAKSAAITDTGTDDL